MTDHKAEAERLLALPEGAQAAQVHATLALATELRTANLIAFSAAATAACVRDSGAIHDAAVRLGLIQ